MRKSKEARVNQTSPRPARSKPGSQSANLAAWEKKARNRLAQVLKVARTFPSLRARVPCPSSKPSSWSAQVLMVGSARMRRLNSTYRKKDYPTDILSFPAPAIFQTQGGLLGELVICVPTLRAQAAALGHSVQAELDLLLTHGVLHLLGLDHEAGGAEAAEMAGWEGKILKKLVRKETSKVRSRPLRGLIDRAS